MNLLKLDLHAKALRHRVLIMRDKDTGRDIGEPKALSAGDLLEIDFNAYPDNVVIVIEAGEPAQAAADEAKDDDGDGLDNLTKAQLSKKLTDAKVEFAATATKADLIEALRAHNAAEQQRVETA